MAIALQVGAQVGRGGVLTQCALEEATELELGMRGEPAAVEQAMAEIRAEVARLGYEWAAR